MKIILFVSILTFLTIGCAKKDEPAAQVTGDTTVQAKPTPEPSQQMSYDMLPPHMRSAVAAIDPAKLRTHASAAKIYINLPDTSMPIPLPPPLRPFTDLQYKEGNDSTAVYTFKAANGRPGDMLMHRIIQGNDTMWIPMHILPH